MVTYQVLRLVLAVRFRPSATIKSLGKGVCPQGSAASSVISMTDFQSVITAIQNQVSVSTVVGVLATLAGIGVGFAFMWWGIRKAQRVIMGSAKSGKLRI